MCVYKILNEDCMITIDKISKTNNKVDIILTSPPYNTGRPFFSEKALSNHEGRYDVYFDTLSQDDYCKWIDNIFIGFDKILKPNGVVLWNASYGNDATVNTSSIGLFITINIFLLG